jgi:transmembrane protein DUF3556
MSWSRLDEHGCELAYHESDCIAVAALVLDTVTTREEAIMGFMKPDLPNVDPDTFVQKPLMERMRILTADWAENGLGTPYVIHAMYVGKLVFFYAILGITVATATSGLPAFWHVTE